MAPMTRVDAALKRGRGEEMEAEGVRGLVAI